MITARTATGSVYEIDTEHQRVRRVIGTKAPTPNQGEDGEWKEYQALVRWQGSYVFVWDDAKSTITSTVISEFDSESTPVGAEAR